jgi:Uma2 family endonuclease
METPQRSTCCQSILHNEALNMSRLTLTLDPVLHLTDQQFFELCQLNQDLKFERTAEGELIIMPPTGGETGCRNVSLAAQLWNWNERTGLGVVFDSSTGFHLPNGADRSPDVAWVAIDHWNALSPQQKQGFPPIAPDFVIELRSPTDSLTTLQNKMVEYLENGVRLGWLINPQDWQVEVYQLGSERAVLTAPQQLSGEEVLPGFSLSLTGTLSLQSGQ